jgi:hypothetical protein
LAPNVLPLFLVALHDSKVAECSVTLTLRTAVSPTAATAAPFDENTAEYPPMYKDTPPPYVFPPSASLLTTQFANALLWRATLKKETLSGCRAADRPA